MREYTFSWSSLIKRKNRMDLLTKRLRPLFRSIPFSGIGVMVMIILGCSCTGKVVTWHSNSIQESKKMGLFIKEYMVQPINLSIDSNQTLRVKEAFVERVYRFDNLEGPDESKAAEMSINAGFSYHLIVAFKDSFGLSGTMINDWRLWGNEHSVFGHENSFSPVNHGYAYTYSCDELPDDTIFVVLKKYNRFASERTVIDSQLLFMLLP